MQQEIMHFANTNPWSTLLTCGTIFSAIIYVIKAILVQDLTRSALILGLNIGLLIAVRQIITADGFTIFVSENTLIYFILLSTISASNTALWTYKNDHAEEGD